MDATGKWEVESIWSVAPRTAEDLSGLELSQTPTRGSLWRQLTLAPGGGLCTGSDLEIASGSDLWHQEAQPGDSQLLASPAHFLW